jgi:hypothetical protein
VHRKSGKKDEKKSYSTKEHTLRDGLFAVTPAHTNAVDDIALLGLVTESASLVGTRRTRCTVDHIKLSVLPAPGE